MLADCRFLPIYLEKSAIFGVESTFGQTPPLFGVQFWACIESHRGFWICIRFNRKSLSHKSPSHRGFWKCFRSNHKKDYLIFRSYCPLPISPKVTFLLQ